jgi:HK97 family phage major capsid protein
MTKLIAGAALATALSPGASAARIFAGAGPGFPRVCFDAAGGTEGSEFKLTPELQKLVDGIKTAHDKVKEVAEKALDEAKRGGQATEETKVKADEALNKLGEAKTELDARIADIEQKLARRPGGEPTQLKTLGQTFVDADEVKSFLSGPKRGQLVVKVETKTILSATGTWGATASVSNALTAPDRPVGMGALPMRPMTIRQLIAPGETGTNSIEYAVQTAFTNNAAVVAENTAKPLSDFTFDLRTAAVRTVAHRTKASRQIMDDAPQLRSFVDAQMRYGLEYAEEAELLYGDNTGQHLNGIVTQATAYSAPFTVTGETAIDRVRLGILQAALALLPPDGIVLNPLDWARIEMVKDGMGRYLIGDPVGQIQPRLWSLPVAPSMALTASTFLTGAFRTAAQIFDRMAIEILLSTEDEDNFSRNMVTIRAEERMVLAVYRPAAFITGSLPT